MNRPADPPTERRPSKPTLRTIADATGFAVTTVSRALADDARIAEATRRKVAKAAKKLGYVPDRAAQRLRTGRTRVLSLLLNPEHEFLGFYSEVLTGFTEALHATGYSVTIVPDKIGGDRLDTVRNILRNRLADGVVFTRTECFDARVRYLTEHGFPFVSHGRTEFTTPHPWVDFDNEGFARWAVDRLVAKGRTRLAIILPRGDFTFAQHLRHGFMSAVRRHGVDYEIPSDVDLESSSAQLSDYVRRRMRQPAPPDGFICVGEVTALSTLAALSDCGLTPGREADVLAKRASPIFEQLRPRIETMFEDLQQTGRELGRLLQARIEGVPAQQLQVLQPAIPTGPD